jgi:hypothetical protein
MYEYYGYCNDLLVKLNARNLRVADVARSAEFAYDDDWKSHIDYSEYVPRVSAMLFRNFLWRLKDKYLLRDFHPLAFCYIAGMGMLGIGVFGGIAALASRSDGADWLATACLGVALFLYGATLDMEDNRALERQIDRRDATPEREPPQLLAED